MRVVLAAEHGFCDGVKRALARLDRAMEEQPGKRIVSVGEIIHNEGVIARYRDRGVETVESIEEVGDGIGVVRAHGLPDSVIARARASGARIIDATCPCVRHISSIISEEIDRGVSVYLVGEAGHPEVIAATADFGPGVAVIDHRSFDEAAFDFASAGREAAVLSQTTMSEEAFVGIVGSFVRKLPKVTVHNTICHSTKARQSSAVEVARSVDAMIVLGGKKSSNSKRLAELCSRIVPTHFVERIDELDAALLSGLSSVGLTAGASTPEDVVQDAVAFLEAL